MSAEEGIEEIHHTVLEIEEDDDMEKGQKKKTSWASSS